MAYTQTVFSTTRPSSWRATPSTWIVAMLTFAYLVSTCFYLYFVTAKFSGLYGEFNADLRGLTWFVIHNYRWFYPTLFGAASALVITKQFFVHEKRINLRINLATAVVLTIVGLRILEAVYLPIKELGSQLQ